MIFLPRCAQFPFLMISSKLSLRSALPNPRFVIFTPPKKKIFMEINIEMNFSLYMSGDGRGCGSRNAQCAPLRSEQWFIKSNLFEGEKREKREREQAHNGGQSCAGFTSAVRLQYQDSLCSWSFYFENPNPSRKGSKWGQRSSRDDLHAAPLDVVLMAEIRFVD